jgi:predicted ATP-grasp superfamily ATP-dependent carboligase
MRKVPESTSRYCDETVVIPSPQDDLLAYKDALVGIAARPNVRTIVPVGEEDIYVLSKYQSEFERYVNLVVPPLDTLRNAHDRMALVKAAKEARVPAPETRLLDDVQNWTRNSIIKSRYNILTDEYIDSFSANNMYVVRNTEHLQSGEEPDVGKICNEMKHIPIIQEFVPIANRYMFASLYDHGEPLATFQHRQIRGNSYTGGGGVYRKSVYVPELEKVAQKLLNHIDWHGLACVEYIEDANTGEFKPIEINPRMWQSSLATAHMGADFPHYYWLQTMERQEQIQPRYELGIGSHYLRGEIGYLMSVLRDDSPLVERPKIYTALWELLSSYYEQPYFDELYFDDPMPFVHNFLRHIRAVR